MQTRGPPQQGQALSASARSYSTRSRGRWPGSGWRPWPGRDVASPASSRSRGTRTRRGRLRSECWPKCRRRAWSRRCRNCSLSWRSWASPSRKRRTSARSWRTSSCDEATSVGSGASGLASRASMPQVWDTLRPQASGQARAKRSWQLGGRGDGSGRLGSLVALEAADVLDIDAVEDHLQLAGRQFQGAGVGRGEVGAAALQALVPDAHAVAVPVEDLEAVGLAVEEDEQVARERVGVELGPNQPREAVEAASEV